MSFVSQVIRHQSRGLAGRRQLGPPRNRTGSGLPPALSTLVALAALSVLTGTALAPELALCVIAGLIVVLGGGFMVVFDAAGRR